MDGKKGKVVCHLRKGGDLKKEMKQRVLSGVVYMTKHDKEQRAEN